MSNGTIYNPVPPRAWPRVQHKCATDAAVMDPSTNVMVYNKLTNSTMTLSEANFRTVMLNKGNVLQHKNNSSRLTKSQIYSKLAKGQGNGRRKVFASQTQTYTNPNNTSYLRAGFEAIPPNMTPGSPNNPNGPYDTTIVSNCGTDILLDGGVLVASTIVEPCTGITRQTFSSQNCYSTTFSDVPGNMELLCWNSKLQPWFPRQNLTMNTVGVKFPANYKGLISALRPDPPNLLYDVSDNIVKLTWAAPGSQRNSCLPISSYNVYINGSFFVSLSYTVVTFQYGPIVTIGSYSFYVTSLSNTTESPPSNTVTVSFPTSLGT